ncbi:MAG TPA: hypothetical protein VNO53_06480, partial [Steroidobacteraceae bacterium]|nr:hypothetical protein [Steroidobacteraceae bacterium]
MTRMLPAACATAALAFAAHADVTIKATATGKGFGISGSTPSTTYIKGLKMRSDATAGKKSISTIFDVDAQKMYILDVDDKKAKVWDMAAFASQLSSTVSADGMQALDIGRARRAAGDAESLAGGRGLDRDVRVGGECEGGSG